MPAEPSVKKNNFKFLDIVSFCCDIIINRQYKNQFFILLYTTQVKKNVLLLNCCGASVSSVVYKQEHYYRTRTLNTLPWFI